MFNVIINSDQYDEFLAQKEKIKELESLVDSYQLIYKNYQQALSDKAALINERDELLIKNNELNNKVIRFKELVTENYRLKMSNNDLKANNKELTAKIKEPVGLMYLMPAKDASKLCEWLDRIEERLDKYDNYFSEEDKK